jgi:hypothetical protein
VPAEVGSGLSNAGIAALLHISEATVKTHVGHIMTRLGLRDRILDRPGAARCVKEAGGFGLVSETLPSQPIPPTEASVDWWPTGGRAERGRTRG